MSDWTFTLAANAGLSVAAAGTRLWIDLPVQAKVMPYSRLTREEIDALWNDPAFRDPDAIVYTHAHPDHYSPALAAEAARRNPQAEIFAPVPVCGRSHLLSRGADPDSAPADPVFQIRGLSLRFFPLTHEGADFADVAHFGLLLSDGTRRALFVGDGRLCAPELIPLLADLPADIAVLPFPWITLRRGRNFITEHIAPKHLVVNHLPFPEDDAHRWREAAIRCAAALPDEIDLRLMLSRRQQEVL